MSSSLPCIVLRTRLRAARLVRFMEALWSSEATSPDQGLSISSGEVRRRLLTPRDQATTRLAFYAADPVCAELGQAIARADSALADDPYWSRLVSLFGLSGLEADLLSAAIALGAAPELGRVFAYLADDVSAILPSGVLTRTLFDRDEDGHLFDGRALRRWRLADAEPALVPALAGWRACEAVIHSLAAGNWVDPAIASHALQLMPPGWHGDFPQVQEEALFRAERRIVEGSPADLEAPSGAGRTTLAAQLAAQREQRLLLADTVALVGQAADQTEGLVAALRMARIEGAIVCFSRAAAAPIDAWLKVLPADVAIVRCYEPNEGSKQNAAPISLAPIVLADRTRLWHHHSSATVPPSISAARVTAGEIARIARGEARHSSDESPPELLSRLPIPYDWRDLVLPVDTELAIRDFAEQVRLRGEVLENWGFGRLSHLGSGLVALFAGPSGVGKTMAAQVLARELGLDLFRIDLAGVVDKYIGETEKRLRAVFAFAERPGVLLMFDEADALFGSRMQAKDSHDRYANLEINYLLQRIESFEGIAVLATNRKSELDNAFRRRLRVIVDFLQPGPEERLKLWNLALPQRSPTGEVIAEGIDHELLADKLSLTGADIKAAVLGAAFLARAEGSRITMRHVLAATQREMAKHGQAMRLPLSEAAE